MSFKKSKYHDKIVKFLQEVKAVEFITPHERIIDFEKFRKSHLQLLETTKSRRVYKSAIYNIWQLKKQIEKS